MKDNQIPIMLTSQQITTLQDMILEKQLEIATAQSERQSTASSSALREQMSHITDLLMALNTALPDNHIPDAQSFISVQHKGTTARAD